MTGKSSSPRLQCGLVAGALLKSQLYGGDIEKSLSQYLHIFTFTDSWGLDLATVWL